MSVHSQLVTMFCPSEAVSAWFSRSFRRILLLISYHYISFLLQLMIEFLTTWTLELKSLCNAKHLIFCRQLILLVCGEESAYATTYISEFSSDFWSNKSHENAMSLKARKMRYGELTNHILSRALSCLFQYLEYGSVPY